MTKDKDEGVGYRDNEGEDDMGCKHEGDSQAKDQGNDKHEGVGLLAKVTESVKGKVMMDMKVRVGV